MTAALSMSVSLVGCGLMEMQLRTKIVSDRKNIVLFIFSILIKIHAMSTGKSPIPLSWQLKITGIEIGDAGWLRLSAVVQNEPAAPESHTLL